jgi:malate dehydrogenase (oxaloacetate-decarboxylating)(NADP+)
MRVLEWEAMAVAKAAMDSGVALEPVDLNAYKGQLKERLEHIKHLLTPQPAVKAAGACGD